MSGASLKEFSAVLARMSDADELHDFLNAMLTPRERARLALRWQLVCMLERGLPQRAIAEELGVSLCKITRGSRELKHGPRRFREIVRQAVSEQSV